MDDGVPRPRHEFKGMAWYSKGHYLLLTTDNNTKFAQTIILRSVYATDMEEEMEGAYLTVTKKGGNNIVLSKIVAQRINVEPEDTVSWKKILRYTVGYKKANHEDPMQRIPDSIWERISPEQGENFIRI